MWTSKTKRNWRNDPDVLLFSPECDYEYQYQAWSPASVRDQYHEIMLRLAATRPAVQHVSVSLGCFSIIIALLTSALASYTPSVRALAAPTTPTINLCGLRQSADVGRYTGPALPASFSRTDPLNTARASYRVVNHGDAGSGVNGFQFLPAAGARPDEMYVKLGTTMEVYRASDFSLLGTYTLPAQYASATKFAIEPVSGDVFMVTQLSGVDRYTLSGTQVWHASSSGPLDSGVGYQYLTGGLVRFASAVRGGGSDVWDGATGAYLGKNSVDGFSGVTQDATTGDILSTNGNDVNIYTSNGATKTFSMQSSSLGGYSLGGAGSVVEIDSNTIAVVDNNGLDVFDKSGQFIGTMGNDPFAHGTGNIETTITGSNLVFFNNMLYYQSGMRYSSPQHISAVSLSHLQLVTGAPQAHPLGVGAGPYTAGSVAGTNYFKPGVTPAVNIAFAPWWSVISGQYTGQYTVRSAAQVKANQVGTPISFVIPSGGTGNAVVPVSLTTTEPGYYEVDVRLSKAGTTTGATCLNYSVGATGQTLFGTGHPAGEAGIVADAYDLGQKMVRASPGFGIDAFIPNGDANSTAPMTFPAATDAALQAVATEAASTGVHYEIQLAEGSTLDKQLVANGKWQSRVQEYVTHFKQYVHYYEAWNEPNNTYSGDPTAWTNNILKPFYTAVKAADPTATVIGGGILDVNPNYWTGVASAGGLDFMDVAGIHTYTGHNRSFEEQGQIAQLQAIRAIFAVNGHPNLPIWDTESGFWQSGPASFWGQGDKVIRKQVLEESIGITNLANFQNLSCYNDSVVTWGELCGNTLSTGGLAGAQFAAETNGRSFSHMITTGMPHVYAAIYGPRSGDPNSLAILWTDDYQTAVVPLFDRSHATAVRDEYGKPSALPQYGVLPINGSVVYLAIPATETLTLQAAELYDGSNLALAATGATTTATSSDASTPVNKINDGVTDMQGHGNNGDGGVSIWTESVSDTDPTVTVTLPTPTRIDRVLLSSQGISSVQTGLRSFDVQIDSGDGTFSTVASVSNNFFDRNHLLTFSSHIAKQIRIAHMSINYSGYADGLPPSFWPDPTTNGLATIYELEAYAPGTVFVPPVLATAPAVSPSPGVGPVNSGDTAPQKTAASSVRRAIAVATSASTSVAHLPTTGTAAEPADSAPEQTTEPVLETKPSVIAKKPVHVNNSKSAQDRRVRLLATAAVSVVIAGSCLFVGYEVWRHRRIPGVIMHSKLAPPRSITVG